MSTNQDLKNKFKIYELVKNHFGLTKKSIELFKYRLFYEPHIAPEYAKILKKFASPEDPLRAKIPITKDLGVLSQLDKGWRLFKEAFYPFTTKYSLTYENFRKNRVLIKKQEIKLMKALNEYYEEIKDDELGWGNCRYNPFQIKQKLEGIGKYKISNKNNLYLVLSLNFADWFLCSTSESWCSCLNLESDYEGAFWTGIPGLIGDKNRALLYITDDSKKEYLGIKTDKIINRSWTLTIRRKTDNPVDRKIKSISVVGEYPNIFSLHEIATRTFDSNFTNGRRESYDFVSRYYLENLFHKHETGDTTCYIYQDTTTNIMGKKNKANVMAGFYSYLRSGSSGLKRYSPNGSKADPDPIYYTSGLKNLIGMGASVCDAGINENSHYFCEHCGDRIIDDDICWVQDNPYCSCCYDEYFVRCACCGESFEIDEMNKTVNGDSICGCCYNRNYFTCNYCNEIYENINAIHIPNTGEIFCEDCYGDLEEDYFECHGCGRLCKKNSSNIHVEEVDKIFCDKNCHNFYIERINRQKNRETERIASLSVENKNYNSPSYNDITSSLEYVKISGET